MKFPIVSITQESMFQPSSPTSRRDSTPLLDKIRADVAIAARVKQVIDAENKEDEDKKNVAKKEESPMLKYTRIQVRIN